MILVIGGTCDALEIACRLYEITSDLVISTATEYGFKTSRKCFPGPIIYGKMDKEDLRQYVMNNRVRFILDASHPYAENISRNVISLCQELGIDYVRFERSMVQGKSSDLILCSTYEEAGELADRLPGNIFISIGINHVEKLLVKIKDKKRIKVRVLPQSETLAKLESKGLDADHIVALKGPFSEEMNYLLFKETQTSVLICKDSGEQGGTDKKIRAAQRLGMKTIMVARPKIDYPRMFSSPEGVLGYFKEQLIRE